MTATEENPPFELQQTRSSCRAAIIGVSSRLSLKMQFAKKLIVKPEARVNNNLATRKVKNIYECHNHDKPHA